MGVQGVQGTCVVGPQSRRASSKWSGRRRAPYTHNIVPASSAPLGGMWLKGRKERRTPGTWVRGEMCKPQTCSLHANSVPD